MTLPVLPWVDWALLAVLLISVTVGLWRGLLLEVLSLFGWAAAYIAAQLLVPLFANLLPENMQGGRIHAAAAFALAFVVSLIAWALLSRLISALLHATPLQAIDRALGALFGFLRGAVQCLAVATVVSVTPAVNSPDWQQSRGAVLLGIVLQGLKPVLPDVIARRLPG